MRARSQEGLQQRPDFVLFQLPDVLPIEHGIGAVKAVSAESALRETTLISGCSRSQELGTAGAVDMVRQTCLCLFHRVVSCAHSRHVVDKARGGGRTSVCPEKAPRGGDVQSGSLGPCSHGCGVCLGAYGQVGGSPFWKILPAPGRSGV
jgi:hypothetical protein